MRGKEQDKIKEFSDLAGMAANFKAHGLRLVLAHGVFDLLHIGHVRYLEQASRMGDILVVTVTPDQFVNKGPGRPAFTEVIRAEVVAALDMVDFVAINLWPTAEETIRALRPDVYAKGDDVEQIPTLGLLREKLSLLSVGGELRFTHGTTSSSTLLLNTYGGKL